MGESGHGGQAAERSWVEESCSVLSRAHCNWLSSRDEVGGRGGGGGERGISEKNINSLNICNV